MSGFGRLCIVATLGVCVALSGCKQRKRKLPKREVTIVRVAWTGVTIKSAIASELLKSLGYRPEERLVSLPLAFSALAQKEADFFLGYWSPSQDEMIGPYVKSGRIVKVGTNMTGAKYTLAVPSYVARAGLRDFSDIARFREKLGGRIYGIEQGNDGNVIVRKMIERNAFGLKGFQVVPSSEAGMLARVRARVAKKEWVVFLGWAPHQMNKNLEMTYLTGSTAETFGPDNGAASVVTVSRAGFAKDQPNVARLLRNLRFTVSMMNDVMDAVNNHKRDPVSASLTWLRAHPAVWKAWLVGVTTRDGKDGHAAFAEHLKRSR